MAAKPDRLDVYTIVERGDRTFWTRVGSAFVNADASVNVTLDALPVNGRLQIRAATPREDAPHDSERRPQGR